MRVTVKKWGNSASIRIPSAVMEAAQVQLNQQVDVREERAIKSFDWRERKAQKKGSAAASELAEIRAKLHALIG